MLNATTTSGGTLAPVFSKPGIGGPVLAGTGTVLDGLPVNQIPGYANSALGTGVLPAGLTFGDLN